MCSAASTRSATPRGCRWRGSASPRNARARRCISPATNPPSLPGRASISTAAATSAPGNPGRLRSRLRRFAAFNSQPRPLSARTGVVKIDQCLAVVVAVRRPHDGMDVESFRILIGEEDAAMVIEFDHHHRTLHPVIERAGLVMTADPAEPSLVQMANDLSNLAWRGPAGSTIKKTSIRSSRRCCQSRGVAKLLCLHRARCDYPGTRRRDGARRRNARARAAYRRLSWRQYRRLYLLRRRQGSYQLSPIPPLP